MLADRAAAAPAAGAGLGESDEGGRERPRPAAPRLVGSVREPKRGGTVSYKLFAYWSAPKPEDVDAFEEYYASTHVPRAAAVPNLVAITTTRTADGFEGNPPPNYRVAEMEFESAEAMAESAGSDAWATMRECSGDIIERFGVTLTVEAGTKEEGTPTA
jgi:uncharacterized protein (TIGR02118 family)